MKKLVLVCRCRLMLEGVLSVGLPVRKFLRRLSFRYRATEISRLCMNKKYEVSIEGASLIETWKGMDKAT